MMRLRALLFCVAALLAAGLPAAAQDVKLSTVPITLSGTSFERVSGVLGIKAGGITDTMLGLTTPDLGTPSALNLSNAMGLPLTTGVSGTLAGANGGTGVVNTGKTITLGGNLATSGAFATTLTVTGDTNVTLPTSGILAKSDLANATLPDARTNLGIGPTIAAKDYGADVTGAADASTALTNGCTAASSAKVPMGLNGTLRVAANLALNCNLTFAPGAVLKPDTGATVTVTGQVSALPTDHVFQGAGNVTLSSASWVSVAWWGALVNTDAFVAIRRAIGSNRVIYFPAGTYSCGSYDTNLFPLVRGNTCLNIDSVSNFVLKGDGATLTADNTHSNSNMISISNASDFTFSDFVLNLGSGIPGGAAPSGFALAGVRRCEFRNNHFNSGWDAAGANPSAFRGDGIISCNFNDNMMPSISQAFDFAYISRVRISGNVATWGTGSLNGRALGIQNDADMCTNYPDVSCSYVSETLYVTIDHNYFNSFETPVLLSAGRFYSVDNNFFANFTNGVLITYRASGNTSSVGQPVQLTKVNNNFFRNDTPGGTGIYIDPSAIVNADSLTDLQNNNNAMHQLTTGVFVNGALHHSNVIALGNAMWAVGTQTNGTDVSQATCAAGISATTGTSYNGYITHC